ncbi:hypothetical protein K458DRAFT_397946 [Lentithecium fluviatile CBS 122367]|uniref:Dynamin N-terminal domain-containing protein n=1 Tax=Lentithecium fluviatile CBS 122367 TaxID=1168545 RepID=A0A6G1JMM0_9PLEO|nr:hypothetical protein K458DRAFT_397946 [Lentithecium fluviatile CBS 122367]
MGKSLLINALLHRRHLSKTSATGGACTASAIKYVHKPGMDDLGEIYDVAIQFMDDTELNEIISEHARRYCHFHFSEGVDPTYHDEKERVAQSAEALFCLLWNAYNDEQAEIELQSLLTVERTDNGDLFIAMGSSLLSNAVSIIDLPGLGDLNHNRTAATNSIRRKADFEIIVAKSDRVRTEEVADAQIKQSIRTHGAINTILVLTMIDRDRSKPRTPVPLIKELVTATENAQIEVVDRINSSLSDDEEYECDELIAHMDALSAYQEYLKKAAQCAFVQMRAETLEAQMRFKYKDMDPDPIRFFSVFSFLYIDWMKKRRREDPVLNPEMTGILKLRQFLLDFLAKIARIVDHESKNDAYAEIRPFYNKHVDGLKTRHETLFKTFMQDKLLHLWPNPPEKKSAHAKVTAVVREWANGTRWNTHSNFLREMSIVKKSDSQKYRGKPANWNQEVMEAISPNLLSWCMRMKKETAGISQLLYEAIKGACNEVIEFIKGSPLSPPLKTIALEEWKQRKFKVLEKSGTLETSLKDRLNVIYQYATTESDTRCMIAKVNASRYEQVQKIPYEESWYLKQKAAMLEAMMPQRRCQVHDRPHLQPFLQEG